MAQSHSSDTRVSECESESESERVFRLLLRAVIAGDDSTVTALLTHGASGSNSDGDTATSGLSSCTVSERVSERVSSAVSSAVLMRDRHGCSLVYLAAREGHAGVISVLVAGGAEAGAAGADPCGTSALYMAAQEGHVEALRVLGLVLRGRGVGVDDGDAEGATVSECVCV
jgi:hypothetical protein